MEGPTAQPSSDNPSRKLRSLNRFGLVATTAWLTFIATYVAFTWNDMWQMDPNEFGDFLAGTFAPLAFLWLVLGFFQQGEELRNSSRALWLQGEELRNSVEQQRQLVEAAREQLSFERESMGHERAELERRSAPIFDISGAGSSQSEGVRNYEFRLVNHGAACSAVKARFTDFRGGGSWSAMSRGRSETFSLLVPTTYEEFEVTLTIEYLNERNTPGVQRYSIAKKKTGGFAIQPMD